MQTRASRSAPESAVYNVRVHAFEGPAQQTLQGLCDVFGLEAAVAQRLMGSVPAVLRHRVSAAEAEACAEALRRLGARVLVEAAAAPSAQKPAGQVAARAQKPPLPPVPGAPAAPAVPARAAGGENHAAATRDALLQPEPKAASAALRDLGREPAHANAAPVPRHAAELEIDPARPAQPALPGRPLTKKAELELSDHPPHAGRSATLELDDSATKRPLAPVHPQGAQTDVAAHGGSAAGQRPHSAVALRVQARSTVDAPSRALPLLQLLGMVVVLALGVWLDSSVIFGNASTLSVILHGLALYQGLIGLRGVTR